MLSKKYFYVVMLLIIPTLQVVCQKNKKDDLTSNPVALYASSLFRRDQILEGVPSMETFENISAIICLHNCMTRKPDCKSFNWGYGECVLMSDSVCINDTLLLTPKEGYAYYDIMDTPDFEYKHLKDEYCRQFGKCSGRCYPRTPHFVDISMNKNEARDFCQKLGRTLPQPRNLEENGFYSKFVKNLLIKQPEIRDNKDMRFWFGISDEESEGTWMYDDGTPVSRSFSAWALGQPDNGGSFASSKEDCGAIGEKGDYKWFDVNCNLKLKFFCA